MPGYKEIRLALIPRFGTRRTLTEDTPVGLGGSTKVTRVREDFIILVRPTILLGS